MTLVGDGKYLGSKGEDIYLGQPDFRVVGDLEVND